MTGNGWVPIQQFKRPRRLIIGIEGTPDSGKTEFAMTAPPGIGLLALDRGYEHVITKPDPPVNRQSDITMRVFPVPMPGQDRENGKAKYASTTEAKAAFRSVWEEIYDSFVYSIHNPAFRTVILDGDSESWDLQMLAEFGTLSNIAPLERKGPNQVRRHMISKAFDSGKNIIFTYRMSPEWADEIRVNSRGEAKKVSVPTGDYRRSGGFPEQDFLVQVQLRALYDKDRSRTVNGAKVACPEADKYGVRILKCKIDQSLIGYELWGKDCCYRGLIEAIYPDSDPAEWGV